MKLFFKERLGFTICGFILMMSISSCAGLRKANEPSLHTTAHRNRSVKERSHAKRHTRADKESPKIAKNDTRSHNHTRTAESKLRSQIVAIAKSYQGTPYKYGGQDPNGFDCSGFVQYVYAQLDMPIPRTTSQLSTAGKSKQMNQCHPGDIILFGKNNRVGHVAIVTEVSGRDIEVIHSTSSHGVVISEVTGSHYWRPRMLFARDLVHH